MSVSMRAVRLRRAMPLTLVAVSLVFQACSVGDAGSPAGAAPDLAAVEAEVTAAVWAFHAADTAMDAEGVVALLWPDYAMLVDGGRVSYSEVAAGSRDFMAGLAVFKTTWSDLRVLPLTRDLAISSFVFRDSIVTKIGDIMESRGPTTFLWERRSGEWRLRFGDSDHYPLEP